MLKQWSDMQENLEEGVKVRILILVLTLANLWFAHEHPIIDFVKKSKIMIKITLIVGDILAYLLMGAVFVSIYPLLPTLIWLFNEVVKIGDIHLMVEFVDSISIVMITTETARRWLKLSKRVRKFDGVKFRPLFNPKRSIKYRSKKGVAFNPIFRYSVLITKNRRNKKMKIPNLTDLMISISEFKKQLSDIIKNSQTKVIVKNNAPVSVVMPYSEYLNLNNNVVDVQNMIKSAGEDITLSNGVQVKVLVEIENEGAFRDSIVIKTYRKMKTSGEYELHYTLHLGSPNVTQTLTNEEIMEEYQAGRKEV